MRVLRDLWDMIQYIKYRHRMKKMTAKQQRIVGQKIYDEAYQVMREHTGDKLGACGVTFSCPYEGHVSYHIAKTFDERVLDEADPCIFARVEHIENNKWLAFAVVRSTTEQDAITAADACVMSAIMKSGTVPPSFSKYLHAVRGTGIDLEACASDDEENERMRKTLMEVMETVACELGAEIENSAQAVMGTGSARQCA